MSSIPDSKLEVVAELFNLSLAKVKKAMDLNSLVGTPSSSQKRFRKEMFYEDGIGQAVLIWEPSLPERVFLQADYHMDLTKSRNLRTTLGVVGFVFEACKQVGLDEIYCTAHSQDAYDFNCMLGFERTDEGSYEHQFEVMKKVL
jgi:hypothetical protein